MRLPEPKPDVIYRRTGDGAVLLSTKDEVYYGLNAVGAHIWERLPPVLAGLDELCAALRGLYPGVDGLAIRADAEELLQELSAHGLVYSPQQGGPHAAIQSAGSEQAPQAQPR